MTLLTKDQAANIAGQMKSTGFTIGSYGGGSGETYHYNQNQITPISQTKSPAVSLTAKIANIGKTVGRVATATGEGVYHFARDDIAKPVGRLTKDVTYTPVNVVYHGVRDWQISRDIDAVNTKRQAVTSAYQAGKMSKQDYNDTLKSISSTLNGYQKELDSSQKAFAQTQADYNHIPSDVFDSASAALAVFTGGGSEFANVTARVAGIGAKDLLSTTTARLGAEKVAQLAGRQGVKVFAENGGKAELRTMINEASNKFEQAALKIPGARNAIERSLTNTLRREAQQKLLGETTSQFIRRESTKLVTALLIKDPIVYHLNVDSGKQIYQEMSTGKYGAATRDAGLQALQLLEGPISGIKSVLGKTGSKLRDLTYGNKSLIDETSKIIGNGKSDQMANYVKSGADVTSATGKTTMKAEEVFRYWQENVLRRASDDVKLGVSYGIENFTNAGVDLKYVKPERIAQQILNHHEATLIMKQAAENGVKGLSKEDAQNLVVVRFDSMIKRGIANAVRQAGDDKQAMTQVIEGFKQTSGNGWVNNATLMTELAHIIDEAPSAEAAAKRIEGISTTKALISNLPSKAAKDLAKLGYGLAVPKGGKRLSAYVTDYNDTRKLISKVNDGDEEAKQLFDPAISPQPQLNAMAGFLTKAGLSPVEANQRAYQALSMSVAKAVDKLDVAQGLGFKGANGNEVLGGQVITSKLEDYIQSRTPNKLLAAITGTFGKARPAITDIRQLTNANIRDALNMGNNGIKITSDEAKQISSAIKQGYLDTPLELRGLGDKTVDYLYKYNPVQKYYSRIQSALRYSYNPFFQAQEAVETAVFSGLQGGNKATALLGNGLKWGKTRDELDATVAKLEDARIFSSSLGGEAASDQVLGRISADITKGQKRDLAGLAQSISSSQGRSIDDILENNPEQIEDALRVVVQYPKRGALSTPLARTLNLAFFPMRYNLKVTKLAGDILSKQPASVQFATVHSLLNLKNWLQSDEGIRWKAQNSDALQVFNWISPLNNIGSLFNTLGYLGDVATGQRNSGPGSLGQLGGLPFGMISQILDSEGIININSPYVEPRTGDVIPNYIPQTTKTKAATAIQDLLGSVFTYPGQTLGLPGKSALLRNATNAFGLDDKGGYLIQQYTTKDAQGNIQLTQKGQNELTPSQKNLIRVLAGDHSQDSLDSLYMDDKGMATLPPSVLPFSVPDKLPTLNKTQLAAAKASAKKTSNSTKRTKPVAQPLGIY